MRIQLFQHVPFEGIGSMQSFFAEVGAEIAYTRFFQGEIPPSHDSYDILLVMGGPMGVYDEEQYPWLKLEKHALKQALNAGKPVLGICLGAQLMAEVLGGTVSRNPHREIGWLPVDRLSGASASWVATCFPEHFTTFHWHGDTFTIPPDAVPLFRSEGCANQGFAWGERAVALQFHPEITPDSIASWVENGAEELQPGPFVQLRGQIMGQPECFASNNEWIASLCRELIRLADDTSKDIQQKSR